ncbi:hypothetical protein [Methylobacterium sp.]|jgi:hypothetical protein|uniref:hypothetical protein n=1 Tax=Methylobacterium sp. TaxID=409 RepID=UPI00261A47DD|nr:hypothetical protein [Methylobacterium sp.]MDB5645051.1 hypothetical protein [Methylobacterium sp.]
MPQNDFSSNLYLQYMEAIQNFIKQPGDLQVTAPPTAWDWGGASAGLHGATWDEYVALNRVLSAPNSDTRRWGSSDGFDAIYHALITTALKPVSENDPEYEKLQAQANEDLEALQSAITGASTDFDNYLQANPKSSVTYQAWLEGDGAAHKAEIDGVKATCATSRQNLSDFVLSKDGPIKDALAKYTAGLTEIVDPTTQQKTKVGAWSVSKRAIDYVNEITNKEPGAPAKDVTKISIKKDSATYDFDRVWGEGSFKTEGFLDFFTAKANGSYEKIDTSGAASDYAIDIELGGFQAIPVSPGQWFDPGFLNTAATEPDNYNENFSPFEKDGARYFFGPGGSLERQITAIVVAYQPSITVKVSEQFSTTMSQTWHAAGQIDIGPFSFGGSAEGQKSASTFTSSGDSFTVANKEPWPVIIGFLTEFVVKPQKKSAT